MKRLIVLLALSGTSLFTSQASAATFTFIDLVTYVDLDKFAAPGLLVSDMSPHSGVFNIAADLDGTTGNELGNDIVGYVPGTKISSSLIEIVVTDNDSGNSERVALDLGSLLAFGGTAIGSSPTPFVFSFTFPDGAAGTIEGDLETDGILNYTVKSTSPSANNDFLLNSAKLTITVDSAVMPALPEALPDGGASLSLLGLGVLCVAGLGKFVWKK